MDGFQYIYGKNKFIVLAHKDYTVDNKHVYRENSHARMRKWSQKQTETNKLMTNCSPKFNFIWLTEV